MAPSDLPIVLFHYPQSPYAQRLVWYLTLRGLPYAECMQPRIMPRPDVAKLGIGYRRIPILAVGRDVYLDTRLIFQKLEGQFQAHPKLGSTDGEHRAIERLLERTMVDGGMFARAVQLLPLHLPAYQDPTFVKDRSEGSGTTWSPEAFAAIKPEAVAEIKAAMDILETTILADDREWLLKTSGPSLADIEAVWIFHWLTELPEALPADQVSAKQFPKVFAWIDRFKKAIKSAKEKNGKPKRVLGDEAFKIITGSEYAEEEGDVDSADSIAAAQGLRKGQTVQISPVDFGAGHKDVGKLLKLDSKEFVLETVTETDSTIRVHAPRHGFRVKGDSKL